jgi:Ca2+-binding RTX toxin-like protein
VVAVRRLIALGTVPALIALGLAVLAAVPATAVASTPECAGQSATIVGTQGNDTIDGTAGDDVIVGLGGDDLIRGHGGSDVICGGPGDDVVRGSRAGGDIYGNGGNDTLYSRGGAGLTGGTGNDTLSAKTDESFDLVPGPGNDLVIGSATQGGEVHYGDAKGPIYANLATGIVTGQGTDTLVNVGSVVGGSYDDTLIGNNENNAFVGREGDDTLIGRGGDDFFSGEQGDDIYKGGPGFDIAEYWDQNHADGVIYGPMTVNLRTGIATGDGTDTLSSIEGASGSDDPDTMNGDRKDNLFFRLFGGNDTVRAGAGNDFVAPGVGANNVEGGPGRDLLFMLNGRDFEHLHPAITVDLGAGTSSAGDTLSGFENVFGTIHDDTLIGDGGKNKLIGYIGNDILRGRGGNDRLSGEAGADRANGGPGTDWCGAETERNCELPAGTGRTSAGGQPWLAVLARLSAHFGHAIARSSQAAVCWWA